jgi:hypothetical protein
VPRAGIFALIGALALTACVRLPGLHHSPEARPAAFPEAEERPETTGLPLALATDDDYVVRVVTGKVTCSGALIEEDRVLTAHHCLAVRGPGGEMLSDDVKADAVRVELGGDHFAWGEVSVRAVLAPTCGYAAGDGDIAILVLERRLVGVPTRHARLDGRPAVGQELEPVGFGRCFDSGAMKRTVRKGGAIDQVMDTRFRLDASICPGDSGGPIVDKERGEIVGVISQAVMDGKEETVGRAEFTRVDAWRALFTQAKFVSDGMSPNELPPVECGRSPAQK